MYRATDLRTLSNIMGWRQNFNNDLFEIDDSLTVSTFGQYYQDVHTLITLGNIRAIAPDFDKITYTTWTIGAAFLQGKKVIYNGVTYVALQDNTGQDPENDDQENPVYWDLFDAFSDWLKTKTEASVLKLLADIHAEKLADMATKNLVENVMLFDGAGRIANTLTNTNSLVGLEIVPIRGKGVTTKIDKIGLQFTGGVEDITCYLMHSSQQEPVKTITLARTKNDSLEWFTPVEDLYLPYDSDENGSGGSWYFVYDQTALGTGVEAIIKDKDWSAGPCRSCGSNQYEDQRLLSKFLEVHPFKTNDQGVTVAMWDITTNIYTLQSNYGLNLQLTVQCDTTDIILEQKKSFENVIGLQVAVDMVREFAYNPEYQINRTQQNLKRMELLYALDGDSTSYKKSGLKHQLDTAKKALSVDLKNMSRVCYSCKNGGLKFKTI